MKKQNKIELSDSFRVYVLLQVKIPLGSSEITIPFNSDCPLSAKGESFRDWEGRRAAFCSSR